MVFVAYNNFKYIIYYIIILLYMYYIFLNINFQPKSYYSLINITITIYILYI